MAKSRPGFTLSELLIALAVLGIIATFTIPKVLTSSSNQTAVSKYREILGVLSTAIAQLKIENSTLTGKGATELMTYLNVVGEDTTSVVSEPGVSITYYNCSDPNIVCYKLHNGSILYYASGVFATFLGNSNLHAIYMVLDPDGAGPQVGGGISIYTTGKLLPTWHTQTGTIQGVHNGTTPGQFANERPDWYTDLNH